MCYFDYNKVYMSLSKSDIHIRYRNNRKDFFKACKKGYTGIISILLEDGLDVNSNNDHYHISKGMRYAYKNGHIDTLQLLLENGSRIDSETLINACMKNDIDTVSLLLKYNANVNCEDDDGYPLIYFTSICKYLDLTVLLLEHGAHGGYREANEIVELNYKIVQKILDEDLFCETIQIQDIVDIVCKYIILHKKLKLSDDYLILKE